MKKKFFIFVLLILFCFNCYADDNNSSKIDNNKGELKANFKRVSLDFSQTNVKNSDEYQDSPYAFLTLIYKLR